MSSSKTTLPTETQPEEQTVWRKTSQPPPTGETLRPSASVQLLPTRRPLVRSPSAPPLGGVAPLTPVAVTPRVASGAVTPQASLQKKEPGSPGDPQGTALEARHVKWESDGPTPKVTSGLVRRTQPATVRVVSTPVLKVPTRAF